MLTDRIDSISSYCDRWCERCRFTSRCSAYAVHAALGMCGDMQEAVELATGAPRDVHALPAGADADGSSADLEVIESGVETAVRETLERETARWAWIRSTPLMKRATELAIAAYRWFESPSNSVAASTDQLLVEALEIVRWDSTFVGAKLARALRGRDRRDDRDVEDDDSAVQNDWNGSAKVALISLQRSEAAWQAIAEATRDPDAAALATDTADLRREVEQMFPDARRFIRPGFDQPHR
jgi:hypothetical protein